MSEGEGLRERGGRGREAGVWRGQRKGKPEKQGLLGKREGSGAEVDKEGSQRDKVGEHRKSQGERKGDNIYENGLKDSKEEGNVKGEE